MKVTRGITRTQKGSKRKNLIWERVVKARFALSPKATQEDLAGRLAAKGIHLDRSAIARIETGDRYVLDFELVALATALKVSTGYLLGEER